MKVKLEDVLEAMDFVNDDTQYYYDMCHETQSAKEFEFCPKCGSEL